MTTALETARRKFRLSHVTPLTRTGLARLWRVRCEDGRPAVLKIYDRSDRGNESAGTAVLRAWAGHGAVQILAENGATVLMEELTRPSLGDLARRGDITTAVDRLAALAARLHGAAIKAPAGLQPLDQVLTPLLTVGFTPACPASMKRDLQRASALATGLLASQPERRPLHGDLHFDNVILTATGARTIDAKGYLGDPAFELANALRHPRGLPDLIRDPAHIRHCLDLYARTMPCPRRRLAQWAVVKCALSIVWRAGGPVAQDAEADLLGLLLATA